MGSRAIDVQFFSAVFRREASRLGEDVVVASYSLRGLLTSELNVSMRDLSA